MGSGETYAEAWAVAWAFSFFSGAGGGAGTGTTVGPIWIRLRFGSVSQRRSIKTSPTVRLNGSAVILSTYALTVIPVTYALNRSAEAPRFAFGLNTVMTWSSGKRGRRGRETAPSALGFFSLATLGLGSFLVASAGFALPWL